MIIFNGSPRGEKSNSMIIIEAFKKEIERDVEIYHLKKDLKLDEHKEVYKNSNEIIFVFPLYISSVPGLVQKFFEEIEIFNSKDKKIGYIVHSGFPESSHSDNLKQYLKRYTEIIGANYMGTVVKGGSESLNHFPEKEREKKLSVFTKLGKRYNKIDGFDTNIVEEIKKPYVLSKPVLILVKLLIFLKVADVIWNGSLKKNNAFKNRYDKPYGE